jgi:hypothetical protein
MNSIPSTHWSLPKAVEKDELPPMLDNMVKRAQQRLLSFPRAGKNLTPWDRTRGVGVLLVSCPVVLARIHDGDLVLRAVTTRLGFCVTMPNRSSSGSARIQPTLPARPTEQLLGLRKRFGYLTA